MDCYELKRSTWGGADLEWEGVHDLIYKDGKSCMGESGIKAVYCENKERYCGL